MKAYIAGPDVFFEDYSERQMRKQMIMESHGIDPVFPAEGDHPRTLFEKNIKRMNGAQICIANATPFNGPSLDVGTAWELGYMGGQGKPLYGYTTKSTMLWEREEDYQTTDGFELPENIMPCYGFNYFEVPESSANGLEEELQVFEGLLKKVRG